MKVRTNMRNMSKRKLAESCNRLRIEVDKLESMIPSDFLEPESL